MRPCQEEGWRRSGPVGAALSPRSRQHQPGAVPETAASQEQNDAAPCSGRFRAAAIDVPATDGYCIAATAGGGKALLELRDLDDDTKDTMQWKRPKGSQPDKSAFGDPLTADDYWLCLYDDGALLSTTDMPPGRCAATTPRLGGLSWHWPPTSRSSVA
ncbi:MAG: hypothetical protein HY899_11125 [Deltaproteobacteria bacterium]|nr:hypothetical protein [Deltaproteobacteria bacterium]